MRTRLLVTLLLMLTANATFAEEADAVPLARDLIAAENARLAKNVQTIKGFLAMVRLTSPAKASQYNHEIWKMESTVALNDRIIRQNDPELLVLTARPMAEGNLERNYASQASFERDPKANLENTRPQWEALKKQEQETLGELKMLKDWLKERQAPDGNQGWTKSADGKLSLRLRSMKASFASGETMTVVAEVRNDSRQPLLVLRPFGDPFHAISGGLAVNGPDGAVKYTGPIKEYVLGDVAFEQIAPGKILSEEMELAPNHLQGLAKPGEYSATYLYQSDGYPKSPVPTNFWTGSIKSALITWTRSVPAPLGKAADETVGSTKEAGSDDVPRNTSPVTPR